MYRRKILPQLQAALVDTPAVLLTGARQTGKTTLVRDQARQIGLANGSYATLDDLEVLAAATSDPVGFLSAQAARGEPVVLDEVQRAPALFPAIKAGIDRDRRPGRFLLTGSANILLLPRIAESLAGRMEILTLWPLAQAEIAGQSGSLVDTLFSDASPLVTFASAPAPSRADLISRVLAGGYPEPLSRDGMRRDAWFSSYITTILQRDVREIAHIDGTVQMPRLLALLAARSAGLLNTADLSRTAGIAYSTLQRYLTLLEIAYLIRPLPAWSGNLGSRLLKAPKILLGDTGLAGYLMGVSAQRLEQDPGLLGGLLENFVAMEILKDASASALRPALYHWHTARREEVDLLLETRDGRLAGIEVKASASVGADAFRGLRALRASVGERLVRGIVLYAGANTVPFGENLFAVPLSVLWEGRE